MKQDNRGVSLVELIVVMAILAVLTGTVGLGIRMVSTKAADQCATQLKTAIQSTRVTTMGKLEAILKVYTTADGICIEETIKNADGTTKVTQKVVGNEGVTVLYRLSDGTEYSLGDSSSPLILMFDRSSGAFKALPAEMGSSQAGKYCVEIQVSRGSHVRLLKLAYLTGKVTLE